MRKKINVPSKLKKAHIQFVQSQGFDLGTGGAKYGASQIARVLLQITHLGTCVSGRTVGGKSKLFDQMSSVDLGVGRSIRYLTVPYSKLWCPQVAEEF